MEPNKYYCKINGTVYNLKKIQDIIDENNKELDVAKIYSVLNEELQVPDDISFMMICIIDETKEIPTDYDEALKELQERTRAKLGIVDMPVNVPRCPRCGSTDIKEEDQYGQIGDACFIVGTDYRCRVCNRVWTKI